MRTISNANGSIQYLNSGDWIENLTALEYSNGQWTIYKYNDEDYITEEHEADDMGDMNNKEVFNQLLNEFNLMS